MDKRDYYEILGCPRGAPADVIKKAYRQAALKNHPDRNPDDKAAEERFKEAAEAYSVLGDAQKRDLYDQYGHAGLRGEGFQGFNSTIFEDFEDVLGNIFGQSFSFGDLFGGARRPRARDRRGRDLALEMELTLEEAAAGVEKEISLTRAETCGECRGSGMQAGAKRTSCPACGGRGQVRSQQGFFSVARTCSHCGGEGEVITSPCGECRGSGTAKQKKSLQVRVPAGVGDGSRLRLSGEGETGERGTGRGDLYVVLRIKKHDFYERQDNHLTCEISLSFVQAALGVSVEIPLLGGGQEKVKIPAGTQSGEVFRIKGAGIREVDSRRTGDLYVRVVVRTPDDLSKEQKALLKQLAELRGESLDTLNSQTVRRSKPAGR